MQQAVGDMHPSPRAAKGMVELAGIGAGLEDTGGEHWILQIVLEA